MKRQPSDNNAGFDWGIFNLTMLLVVIGTVMVFSASYVQSGVKHHDTLFFLKKNIVFSILGLVLMLYLSKVDYRIYKRYAVVLMALNLILLWLTRFTGLGIEINSAKRWLDIGFSTLMTSEVTKFSCILLSAAIISSHRHRLGEFSTILKVFIWIIASVALVLMQPDLSTSATILFVGFGMLFIAGIRYLHTFMIIGGGLSALGLLIAIEPYRLKRFTTFLNPFEDRLGNGYQVIQSLYALASGGIMGQGLGKSRQKFFYLPEPQNDFIFAIIGEELGYIGGIILLIIFSVLIAKCLKLASNTPNMFAKMLVSGITLQIAVQMLINVGVATSSIPNTGIPLPFISYGGTSLVIFMGAMGVILNISRYSAK